MSWPKVKLRELISLIGGHAFKSGDFVENGIPLIRIGTANSGIFKTTEFVYLPHYYETKYSKYLVKPNDLLITLTGTVGKGDYGNVCEANDAYSSYLLNQRVAKINIKSSNLYKRYLYLFLATPEVKRSITSLSRGVRQANIKNDDILDLEIPLPPLDEQKRIATILDKADAIRCKRQQAIDLAEDFLRSVFLDMFGDPVANPKGWETGSFSDISEINPRAEKYADDLKVSFVPMPSVSESSHELDASNIRQYSEVKKGFTAFKEHDVLFAKITPCMENGKAAIAQNLMNGIGFGSTEFHVFRPKDINYSIFIYSLIHLPLFRTIAASNFSGAVGHKRVPKDFLADFKLILPPENLIKKFSDIFEKVNAGKEKFNSYEIFGSELFNSLSQQAFAGEL